MWFSRSFRKSFIFQGFPCSRVPRTFNILPPVYSLVNIFLKLILRFFDFLFLTLYITKQSPGFQPLRRRFIWLPLRVCRSVISQAPVHLSSTFAASFSKPGADHAPSFPLLVCCSSAVSSCIPDFSCSRINNILLWVDPASLCYFCVMPSPNFHIILTNQ